MLKTSILQYFLHQVLEPGRVAPPLPYSTACSGTKNSHTLKETVENEEAEGFLTYRVADRRRDHSDHRGYRNS
jgi:hypothetical protein